MSTRSVIVAVLALACAALVAAEDAHVSVINLTDVDYETTIGDGKVYFVKYYAPWCGHCKKLAPIWEELAVSLKENASIGIAHVDCTVAKDTCTANEIKGYPTLKVVHKGEIYKAHKGPRDLASLKSFIEDAASDLVTETA